MDFWVCVCEGPCVVPCCANILIQPSILKQTHLHAHTHTHTFTHYTHTHACAFTWAILMQQTHVRVHLLAHRCMVIAQTWDTRPTIMNKLALPAWLAHLLFMKAADGDMVLLKVGTCVELARTVYSIYTPYMTVVCMVISLPKIPYIHRIYL